MIVFVHGVPDTPALWEPLIAALGLKPGEWLAPALPGFGRAVPAGFTCTKDAYADWLIAELEKLNGPVHLVGHDWGAAQAWNYAFAHPETLERLVIMSVPHPANMGRQLKAAPQNSSYARNFQKEGSENNLTAEGLAGWVKDPAERAKYVEAFKRSSFAGMMNYYRANYPSAPEPDAPAQVFPKINVPVLVIHGMKDTALLSMGHNDTWDQVSKDTTLVMAPDAGHFVQHDAADLVNGSVRAWLDLHPVK